MSNATYHIKVKKDYASAILEDLQQVKAIEIMEDPIPAWQKKESLKRLAAMKSDPSKAIDEKTFFKILDEDAA